MAVTKKPNKSKSVDDFIENNDSKTTDEVKQISLSLKTSMLSRVDSCSDDLGISRAAFIKQAVSRALKMEGY